MKFAAAFRRRTLRNASGKKAGTYKKNMDDLSRMTVSLGKFTSNSASRLPLSSMDLAQGNVMRLSFEAWHPVFGVFF